MKKIMFLLMLTGGIRVAASAQSAMPADTALNKPAKEFTLKDLDGKNVSLADYKGKVVVIDFWATWCPPCKASFPAAQMAVDKYKNDPDVVFLFVDTRETAANYPDLVRAFLKEHQYTFHVVLDEKGEDGKQNKLYKTYVMPGIPTKFIIDKKGIIRFKEIGYNPSMPAEQGFKELSDMIEATKKQA